MDLVNRPAFAEAFWFESGRHRSIPVFGVHDAALQMGHKHVDFMDLEQLALCRTDQPPPTRQTAIHKCKEPGAS